MLARSGQPEVGWLGWRSPEDEELVKALSEACAANRLSGTVPCAPSTAAIPAPASNGDTAGEITNGDVPSLRDLSEEALLFKNAQVCALWVCQ